MAKKAQGGGARRASPKASKSKEETRKAILQRELKKLSDRHGRITPEIVVEAARDPSSPLHREFDWNDPTAAHAARLDRARQLITTITVMVIRRKERITSVFYVRDPRRGSKEQGYVSLSAPDLRRNDATDIMMSELDRCEAAIDRARGVVSVLDARFPGIREDLDGLLEEVVRVRSKMEARKIERPGATARP